MPRETLRGYRIRKQIVEAAVYREFSSGAGGQGSAWIWRSRSVYYAGASRKTDLFHAPKDSIQHLESISTFLLAEVIAMLIADTETTAHTLSFAVAELCLNQRVFQQARAVAKVLAQVLIVVWESICQC